MKNVRMLAMANIRKNKGQAVNLLLFVIIAAMFLNIGLLLYVDYGNSFDKRAEELHAPHQSLIQNKSLSTEEQYKWLQEHPQTVEWERHDVVSANGEYYLNGDKTMGVLLFESSSTDQKMNPLTLIGESHPLEDGSIYVPYLMKVGGGYELGDDFRVNLSGEETVYQVAGFTEEIPFGTIMNQSYRFYVSDQEYGELLNRYPEYECDLMSMRLRDFEIGTAVETEYVREFFYKGGTEDVADIFVHGRSYTGAKGARTFIAMIVAMVVTTLAAVLLLVCAIVMRFGIVNNIEESMVNIGVLKAAGFGNRQIVGSILLQFGGLAAVGGILGVAAAWAFMPVLASILEGQSAMIWEPGFSWTFAIVTIVTVTLAVLLTSFLAARRIYRLHPLVALRGGLTNHNFKRNGMPLDRSRGGLSFLLAMKRMVRSKGQCVMIAMIIAAITAASVIGVSIYHAIGVETYEFVSVLAGETQDAAFELKDGGDTEAFIDRIRERKEVRKAFGYDGVMMLADEAIVVGTVTKDYEVSEEGGLVEGRQPKHANEVAVGHNFLKSIGKKIGDTVRLQQGGTAKDFLVTGIVQGVSNDGFVVALTYEGVISIQPGFESKMVYVHVVEGTDVADFIRDVEASEGDKLNGTVNLVDLVDAQFGQMGGAFGAVAVGILAMTVVVVMLVLYLVIKTMLLRNRREFGIQKAVGFTTPQIMNQIALGFVPVVLAGVAVGVVGGVIGLNPMFVAITSGMGIVETHFSSPPSWVAATGAFLLVLAYAASMLFALRVRKISAHALITE